MVNELRLKWMHPLFRVTSDTFPALALPLLAFSVVNPIIVVSERCAVND